MRQFDVHIPTKDGAIDFKIEVETFSEAGEKAITEFISEIKKDPQKYFLIMESGKSVSE